MKKKPDLSVTRMTSRRNGREASSKHPQQKQQSPAFSALILQRLQQRLKKAAHNIKNLKDTKAQLLDVQWGIENERDDLERRLIESRDKNNARKGRLMRGRKELTDARERLTIEREQFNLKKGQLMKREKDFVQERKLFVVKQAKLESDLKAFEKMKADFDKDRETFQQQIMKGAIDVPSPTKKVHWSQAAVFDGKVTGVRVKIEN